MTKLKEIRSELQNYAEIGNYKKLPRCLKMGYRTSTNKPHSKWNLKM